MFLYPISNFWKGILSFFLMNDCRNVNITNSAFNSPKKEVMLTAMISLYSKGIERNGTRTMYTYILRPSHISGIFESAFS